MGDTGAKLRLSEMVAAADTASASASAAGVEPSPPENRKN